MIIWTPSIPKIKIRKKGMGFHISIINKVVERSVQRVRQHRIYKNFVGNIEDNLNTFLNETESKRNHLITSMYHKMSQLMNTAQIKNHDSRIIQRIQM